MAAISGVMASQLAMVRTHTCEVREGESEGEREREEGRGGRRERRKRGFRERANKITLKQPADNRCSDVR